MVEKVLVKVQTPESTTKQLDKVRRAVEKHGHEADVDWFMKYVK